MVIPHALVNAVLFQVTWFSAVLGGSLPALAACGVLTAHLVFRSSLRADITIAAITTAVGFCLDTLWIHLNVLDFNGATLAPVWIVVLWTALGLSLNHSMSVFLRRPLIGAILAGASAPLSYLSGAALGGVIVPERVLLAVVSASWFVFFYLLFRYLAPFINRQFGVRA